MKSRQLAWFSALAIGLVLSCSTVVWADEVRPLDPQSYQRRPLSLLVTEPITAEQVEPLTSEKPMSGKCTGTFNTKIGDQRAELCPIQYSIGVPEDVEELTTELERQGLRNIHTALAFGRPIGPGVEFFVLRDFGRTPEFRTALAFLRRPDLTTGTWYIAIFNFEEGSPEPYTLTANISPVRLTSGRPWDGSVIESTLGGRYQPGGCLLGGVDYTIEVPSDAQSLTIGLQNKGAGNINLYARFGRPVEISGGRLVADHSSTSPGGIERITITPTSSPPLRAGKYFIAVANCETSRQFFTLIATVTSVVQPQPVIQISPSSFSFQGRERGPNPSPQTLTITNGGGGTLNWTIRAESAPWLRLSPSSGSAPPPSTVSVWVELAGLAAGSFEGRIIVEAPGATNSPLAVPVSLLVGPPESPAPVIQVEPGSLSFSAVERGTNPPPQTLRITNAGGGTLNWSVRAENAPWLKLSPTSGSAPPPSTISVSVEIAGLVAGSYTGRIVIEAPGASNSPLGVSVTVTVQPLTGGQLIALKFIKLEFLDPAAWSREIKEGCVVYKNISEAPSKLRVTTPDGAVLEFDIPAGKLVIVCGDVVHIDMRTG